MTITAKPVHRLSYWLAGITILSAMGLADAAAVAIPAMVASLPQVFAVAAAFTMIAGGVLYTVWNMETGTPPKS